jgi:hypothetical protein
MKWRLVLVLGSLAPVPLVGAGCAGCETPNEASSADAGRTSVSPASPVSQGTSAAEAKVPPGMADPLGGRIRPRFFLHRDGGVAPPPSAAASAP